MFSKRLAEDTWRSNNPRKFASLVFNSRFNRASLSKPTSAPGAVENFRLFDLKVYPFADPEGAVAEVKAEDVIKPTGHMYHQDYVLFLRAAGGKIVFLREYFDPVRAAKTLDTPIVSLES